MLLVAGVAIAAVTIGLPDFQQHIADKAAAAVKHPAFQGNALALSFRLGQYLAEVILKNLKTRGQRSEANVHIRPGGLRRGFL
ncbi:hypothetical protein D3C71_2076810 [compost metagenome]